MVADQSFEAAEKALAEDEVWLRQQESEEFTKYEELLEEDHEAEAESES